MARGGSPPRASRAARRHGLVAVRSALFAEEARRRLPFASTASTGASSARARAISSRVSAITSMTDTNAWRAPAAAWRAGPSADVRCTSTMPSFVAEEDLPHLDLREAVEPGGRGAVGAVRALEPRRLFAERGLGRPTMSWSALASLTSRTDGWRASASGADLSRAAAGARDRAATDREKSYRAQRNPTSSRNSQGST